MSKLPSKRIILLVIVLVVITISVLWYAGYKERKKDETRLAQYTQEILSQQKNIEAVAVNGLKNDEPVITPIEKTPSLIISTSTASSTAQLRNYRLAVTEALKPLNIKRGSEPQAVFDAIDKNDKNLLNTVTISKLYHRAAAKNLSGVIIPKEMVAQHKKLISDLNFLVSILTNMEMALEQPEVALNNTKSFISNYSTLIKSLEDINSYLATKGVKLSSQEKLQVFESFTQ